MNIYTTYDGEEVWPSRTSLPLAHPPTKNCTRKRFTSAIYAHSSLEEKWARMLFLDALRGFFGCHFLRTLSTHAEAFEKTRLPFPDSYKVT